MFEKAQNGLCFPLKAIMKVYSLLDGLSETKGFYAVSKFMTIMYELSMFTKEARALSSSSFARIEVQSDSRRVQKVQDYINRHYQEEIRLATLANMVGMTEVSFSRFFKPVCWWILPWLLQKSVTSADSIISRISIGFLRKRRVVHRKSSVSIIGKNGLSYSRGGEGMFKMYPLFVE